MRAEDAKLAWQILGNPLKWDENQSRKALIDELLGTLRAESFTAWPLISGRQGLYAALKAYGVGSGDEVVVQGFTCVAVVNPVLWLRAKPIYVDVKAETLNIDLDDLANKITSRTKAVILQHTFGLPFTEWERLRMLLGKSVLIIEDCAHALGATVDGQAVGTNGDVSVFSFGRDKVVSSVFGGALLVNPKSKLAQNMVGQINTVFGQFAHAPKSWILRQLLHPLLSKLILDTYSFFGLGKLIHFLALRSNILSRATSADEKDNTKMPNWIEWIYPGGLAELARQQLKDLVTFNFKRLELAKIYTQAGITCTQEPAPRGVDRVWLRYSVLVRNPLELHALMRSQGVVLGDWYDQVVAPKGVNLLKKQYNIGSAPLAEQISAHIINLPLSPTMEEEKAKQVVEVFWQVPDELYKVKTI